MFLRTVDFEASLLDQLFLPSLGGRNGMLLRGRISIVFYQGKKPRRLLTGLTSHGSDVLAPMYSPIAGHINPL
jgi:hypothetical protein